MNKKWFLLTIFICCLTSYCAGEANIAADEKKEENISAFDDLARTVLYLEFDQVESEIIEHKGQKVECDIYYINKEIGLAKPKRINSAGTDSSPNEKR